MKSLFILLSLLLAPPLDAAAPAPKPYDVSAEELEVYSAYLVRNFKAPKGDGANARDTLVVENESYDLWQRNRRAWEAYLTKRITGPGRASEACLNAFLRRPQKMLRFFSFPPIHHEVKLVRSDELLRVMKGGWEGFYAAYPGAQGYLTFGGLAWGSDGNEALFTVRSLCGRKCGFRDIVYMQKINGNWELILKESLP